MAHLKALIVRELSPFLMMQDHARAFAGSQSDEHKYQLFMKAMGFEAIMQRQNASDAQIQTVKEHLQKWRSKLKVVAQLRSLVTCCS